MMISGVANCKIGRIKLLMLNPLANQTIISESLYQRTKTISMATKSDTVNKTAR